jgi:gliding motility-associated-like protein
MKFLFVFLFSVALMVGAQSEIKLCDPPVRVLIAASYDNATMHQWYMDGIYLGEHLTHVELTDTGTYLISIIASNEICEAIENLIIQVVSCSIWIPNSFTPNGDGINDFFEPKGINLVYEMQIYDRWGRLIYDGQNGWSGFFKSQIAPSGVYAYKILHNGKLYYGRVSLIQ